MIDRSPIKFETDKAWMEGIYQKCIDLEESLHSINIENRYDGSQGLRYRSTTCNFYNLFDTNKISLYHLIFFTINGEGEDLYLNCYDCVVNYCEYLCYDGIFYFAHINLKDYFYYQSSFYKDFQGQVNKLYYYTEPQPLPEEFYQNRMRDFLKESPYEVSIPLDSGFEVIL